MAERTRERERAEATPPLEWAVGALGALIFVGLIAVLVATGLGGADAPPSVRVAVERIAPVEAGYVVEFIARNSGDITAADIEIVATLDQQGAREERRVRFDYMPPRSRRRGGVFFDSDPRTGQLAFRVEGYRDT